MTLERHRRVISLSALAIGAALFAGTLYYIDFDIAIAAGRRLGRAIPLALLASGAWHVTRTWAWSWCFAGPRRIGFRRLLRIRLAAEAFSYLTVAGVAGEPLKVVLLGDRVSAREATASVALERIAYMVGTTLIVGACSLLALETLPLSRIWVKIFRGFIVGSGFIATATALVLIRRDSYLLAALRAADRAAGTHFASGKAGRFAGDVARQLGELVGGNVLRLIVLTLASVIAYTCMAAEAWFILRAVGIPVSFTGAVAIETFSRVASFASAFIPASLGALEASSLAAVTAVGATAAGAPLALARRLRGLFWAGFGLAIYPRHGRGVLAATAAAKEDVTPKGPILLYLPTDPAVRIAVSARVAGLPVAERVLRSAFRAGYARVIVRADDECGRLVRRIAGDVRGDVRIAASDEDWERALRAIPTGVPIVAIGAGTVVSPALLGEAARAPFDGNAPADVPAGADWPISGLLRLTAADAVDRVRLQGLLHQRLVEHAPLPSGEDVSHARAGLALRMLTTPDIDTAEQTIRRSSYKPTDNKVARFNRRMSLPISIALIRTPLTANQLSVALVAIGFYSAWLFSLGHYWPGVLGAFLSLAASVLDGCDGEIARLKYQESALGCWIETFGDYSYYIAIFVGLTVGAVRYTGWPIFYWFGAIALAGTLVAFALLIYLRSRITAGRPERLHSIAKQRFKAEPTWWSRIIWRISFVATRSAMPYGIMGLAVLGLLPLVVFLAAIGANTYWISMVLKLRHLLGEAETETVAA